MNKKHRNTPKETVATLNLSLAGKAVQVKTEVPTGKMRVRRMLPVFEKLTESFVGIALNAIEAEGLEISCAKGCGACCRQMVPISEIEAHRLAQVVDEMPEPRKTIILERFEEAKRRMLEAGLLENLQNTEEITNEDFREFGLKYFFQGVACPFLEDESCSIHLNRPIVCREYLVVSPAENCSRLNDEPIEVLKIPFEVSKAVRYFKESQTPSEGWMPLIIALDWVNAHPETSTERPGTEIFSELLKNLTDCKVSNPPREIVREN